MGLAQGQLEDEAGTALYQRIQAQIAAHAAAEAAAEGETEADAGGGVRGFVRGFAEGLEQSSRAFRTDALAVVTHTEQGVVR